MRGNLLPRAIDIQSIVWNNNLNINHSVTSSSVNMVSVYIVQKQKFTRGIFHFSGRGDQAPIYTLVDPLLILQRHAKYESEYVNNDACVAAAVYT